MAHSTRFAVKFRRRREGSTNYKKRLKMLQSRAIRLIAKKSNKYITLQFIEYHAKGDKTLAVAHSSELKNFGWNFGMKNIPAAYLTGLLAAKKAKEKKITTAIFDIGLYSPTKGAKVFAALKGAVDGGLKIAHSAEIIPKEDRITGQHIAKHLKKSDLTHNFEQVRQKLK